MIVITKIINIFVLMGIGVILGKLKIIPKHANVYISRLVVLVGSPCLIFEAILRTELSRDIFQQTIEMVIGSIFFFIAGSILSLLVVKMFKFKKSKDAGIYMVLLSTINGGFMGFPLMQAAFGEDGLFLMVLGNIILNFYIYTYGVIVIKYVNDEKSKIGREVFKSICNPCIVASALGLIFFFVGFNPLMFAMEPIRQVANITVPLSMISIGVSICDSHIREITKNKRLWCICLIKNIAWPALMFFAVIFTAFEPLTKNVLILMAALPPAVSMGVLVKKLNKNAQLASEGIALSTLMGVITIPLVYIIIIKYFAV